MCNLYVNIYQCTYVNPINGRHLLVFYKPPPPPPPSESILVTCKVWNALPNWIGVNILYGVLISFRIYHQHTFTPRRKRVYEMVSVQTDYVSKSISSLMDWRL